jgi:polyphosphate kinase
VPRPDVTLPAEPVHSPSYRRPPRRNYNYVPDHVAQLVGDPESTS